ncbi:MAG TPA: PKD domain-containing protein [Flavisolibacter sp.]|jgi:hypothetical protein|nr:PKD domain-containing protein [Flavisolibacter sp.]
MKSMKFVFLVVSIAVLFQLLYSCQKEISCEDCKATNKPPIAIAGPDTAITLPADSILLDGGKSNDPDGKISEWLWTRISGPVSFSITASTSERPVVRNLMVGSYQFELKVTDDKGTSAKDTVMITVDAVPIMKHPPVANAGSDTVITLPTDAVTLDGTNSIDPDNNITGYQWTKISGPQSFNIANVNAPATQVSGLTQGVFQFQLKVTDADNLFSLDTVAVAVNAVNNPPVNHSPIACAGADQLITLLTNTVTLNGSCSTDPDNNIAFYEWTKISGPSSFSIVNAGSSQTQVNNLTEGVYQFELKVTDAAGLFDKDTVQVTVMGQPPVCTNCKIVFVSNRDGNDEIYSCNSDGSNIRRLTANPGLDGQPAWSPDGTHIAFISDRTGSAELYTMNADGSNVVRKTFSGSTSQNPSWSPDGTRIAYSTLSNGSTNIWVVSATNGSPLLLFEEQGQDLYPAWSPDGTKIALVSDWYAFDFVLDIFTIKPDGTQFTALTGSNLFDNFNYVRPSWSPNGTKIAMAISRETGINQYETQVGVMNSNGSGLTAIKWGAAPWTRTSWSGDGSKIVYTSLTGSGRDISWVTADGSASGTIVTNGWDADWQH